MDAYLGQGKLNFWLAEQGKTRGEGFTIKVDRCVRRVLGFQIKNKEKRNGHWICNKGVPRLRVL